jgi:PKD repeat protein
MGFWTGTGVRGMWRGLFTFAIAVAVLAATAGSAAAQSAVSFTVSPSAPMEDGVTSFSFQGPSAFQNGDVQWDLNGNGSYETSGRTATRTYTSPGQVTVRMRANRSNDGVPEAVVTRTITVLADPGPTAAFGFAPAVPLPGERVALSSTSRASQGSLTAQDWDLDGDGGFDDAQGAAVSTSFASAGTRRVRLRVRQTNGKTAVRELTVRVNAPPAAAFSWSPTDPIAGHSIDFTSSSSDAEGQLTLSWDLDGDGLYGDASGARISHPFSIPGTYEVGLQATDSDGVVSTVRRQVVVAAPLLGADQPGGGRAPAPRLMKPFPVVRIAGVVMRRGARVKILSVRTPRGAQVRVRCKGRGCPVGTVAQTSANRIVRFGKFERRLRAGLRLELFVRQQNRIGKYTRFVIRAGEPPKRVDRCLYPGKRRPARCP